eukprot:135049-Prymnesium_polylepis.1
MLQRRSIKSPNARQCQQHARRLVAPAATAWRAAAARHGFARMGAHAAAPDQAPAADRRPDH